MGKAASRLYGWASSGDGMLVIYTTLPIAGIVGILVLSLRHM